MKLEKNLTLNHRGNVSLIWYLVICFIILPILSSCGGDSNNVSGTEEDLKIWHHPEDTSSGLSLIDSEAFFPKVATDNTGDAIIVWSQENISGEDSIYLSEYRNGVWWFPQSLDDHINITNGGGSHPQVAMDNNGNAVVVWNTNMGPTYMSEFRNGSWTHPAFLSESINPIGSLEEEKTFQPKVFMNGAGAGLIIWKQRDGGGGVKLYLSEYRNNQWHHPASIDDYISPTPQTGTHLFAQDVYDYWADIDEDGDAIIAWTQMAGDKIKLFKSEFRDGVWTHPVDVDDFISISDSSVRNAQVAMSDNGEAVIAWEQPDSSNGLGKIFVAEYRNANWSLPSSLADNVGNPDEHYELPLVAMDGNGNTRLLYTSPWTNAFYMSEYVEGYWTHNESPATEINPLPSLGLNVNIAMNSKGNTIVAWRSMVPTDDRSGPDIFLSEYNNNSWEIPSSIEDYINPDHNVSSTPEIAMNENGEAIIVWQQYTENGYQIFASHKR